MGDDDPADDRRLLRLSAKDNIAVATANLRKGQSVRIGGTSHVMRKSVGYGHKLALEPIAKGAPVYKYGAPVGSATVDIATGEYVHVHNMKSDYIPTYSADDPHSQGENR